MHTPQLYVNTIITQLSADQSELDVVGHASLRQSPTGGGTVQIATGVYAIGNWKGGQVRAFLFDDGHELSLMDTLFETDARLILAEMRSIGRTPADSSALC